MLPQSASSRFLTSTFALITLLLLGMPAFHVNGQSATDASTPPGQAPGAPVGSYPISGFDNVNLFNGHLNFSLPLLRIGGRGEAGYTITLPIEQRWVAEHLDPSTIIPVFNWWAGGPEFGPGRIQGRQTSQGCPDVFSFTEGTTQLSFIMPDKTEIELIDQVYGGQPASSHCGPYSSDQFAGTSRGTTFVSRDGTSVTFVSDQPIKDILFAMTGPYSIYPTGYLSLRDGTRYRIVGGKVQWIRDRNGNKVTFAYDVNGINLTSVTDSLNRQVTFDYDVQDAQCGTCNRINFKGAGGASRKIWVVYKDLGNALAPGQTLKTYGGPNGLFPELSGSSTTQHNPRVLARVILPNTESYDFYYNSYVELAKVKLPTGGTITYEWGPGDLAGTPSGYSTWGELYRRVLERRTYTDDGITLASLTSFGRYDNLIGPEGSVLVKNLDIDGSQAIVTQSKHYFFDGPLGYIDDPHGWPASPLGGREKQTEDFHTNGSTILRRVTHTWTTGGSVAGTPINPRVTQSIFTIEPAAANLVSKQTFAHDTYNNQTDIYEYDFQPASPGSLVRRTHTDYLTTNAVNGINYATSSTIHLRSLIQQQQVFDGNGVQRSLTTYEYDNYGTDANHAGLTNRTNISGLDSSFTTAYSPRGNPTAVTRSLLNNAGGVTGSISTYRQYDIAGNGVKTIDGRGYATDVDFADRFGSADGNAQANSGPPELGTQVSYAFPTKTTNALGHTVYSQVDYYMGAPVDTEDADGVVSSRYYIDSLDRITQVRLAVGTNVLNQITFDYNDAGHLITVSKDRDNFNDNLLVNKSLYDGLGRTKETRQYESSSDYISTKTEYDALGRPYKVSNPFRPWQGETPVWTTMAFDALGRVLTVTTPDNAVVGTSYSGNTVTVTDQAGKARQSVTDALGRLTEVYEDPAGVNYQTSYLYDALDNLTTVTQGSQQRFFMYDSLKRLIRADNPEQEPLSALSINDPVTNNGNWSAKYEYDNNGNLTFKTDARGVVTENRYDELNRLTTVLYRINGQPDPNTGDIQYVYDSATYGKGRLWLTYRWGAKPSHTAVGEYDALGRVKQLWNLFGDGVGGWSVGYGVSRNYNLAGQVTSQTYPSGRTVNYSYDVAGRTTGFTGNLGDGVTRSYASSFLYNARSQVTQELFGTQTPLYHKLQYNIRGQLWDVRVSTNPDVNGSLNRGGFQYFYEGNLGYGTSGPDNNGNVLFANTYTPEDEQLAHWAVHRQSYAYDSLNRLKSVTEYFANYSHPESQQQSVQTYDYDPWGNRTINAAQTSGSGINNTAFEVETARNRLYSPGDLVPQLPENDKRIRYDKAGNQIKDTYTGYGTATYDGDNHIVAIQDKFGGSSTYTYNANAQRVRRRINNQETWQIYGIDGELVAEYAANSPVSSAQKEYGYRDGQLLITAEASAAQNVSWTNAIGVSVNGNSLTKTTATGWGTAGATSAQSITAGDGYMELTVPDTTTHRFVGLSNGNSNSDYTDVDFAIHPVIGGTIFIYEGGISRGTFGSYTAGDKLRVAVEGGVVKYRKNGALLYTSTITPTYPLLVDSALHGTGDTLSNVVISGTALISAQSVTWQNVVGAAVSGNSLTKTAAIGWGTAGATSTQSISAGDGYMELTVPDTTTHRFVGLSNGNSNSDYTDVDFAIHPVIGGTIFIYEGGVSRGTFGSYTAGDVLRVAVEGGVVKYRKNGALLYTSTIAPTYPLLVDSALHGTGDTLSNVVISSAASGAAKVQWLVPDHLGTPRIILDQTGAFANVKRHDYLPFGEELAAGTGGRTAAMGYVVGDGIRQQFTSKERDSETGLDYFGARYYASPPGRFTSADEIWKDSHVADPQSWNKYAYARNNPLKFIDPTGEAATVTIETDENNKTGKITVTASIGLWTSKNTGISQKDLEKAAQEYKANIEKSWNGTYEQKGIKFEVSVTVNISAYSSEEAATDSGAQNVLQVMLGEGHSGIRPASLLGGPDRGEIALDAGTRNSEAAHEFTHILGVDDRYSGAFLSNTKGAQRAMSVTAYDYGWAFGGAINDHRDESRQVELRGVMPANPSGIWGRSSERSHTSTRVLGAPYNLGFGKDFWR